MTITKNHLLICAALVAAWYVLKGKGCTCGGAAAAAPVVQP